MTKKVILSGVAHEMPTDLRKALSADSKALSLWQDFTPLARNEWTCWTISVKRPDTRKEHISRVVSQLKEGKRRPCCWIGCIHRTNKKLSSSQKVILGKRSKK